MKSSMKRNGSGPHTVKILSRHQEPAVVADKERDTSSSKHRHEVTYVIRDENASLRPGPFLYFSDGERSGEDTNQEVPSSPRSVVERKTRISFELHPLMAEDDKEEDRDYINDPLHGFAVPAIIWPSKLSLVESRQSTLFDTDTSDSSPRQTDPTEWTFSWIDFITETNEMSS